MMANIFSPYYADINTSSFWYPKQSSQQMNCCKPPIKPSECVPPNPYLPYGARNGGGNQPCSSSYDACSAWYLFSRIQYVDLYEIAQIIGIMYPGQSESAKRLSSQQIVNVLTHFDWKSITNDAKQNRIRQIFRKYGITRDFFN